MTPERTGLSQTQQTELDRAKRAARWVGLILPLALLTIVVTLVLIWLPRVPNPAATHWGLSGGPNGFGSPLTYVWMTLLTGHGIVILMWAFIEFGSRMPAPSPKRAVPVWGGSQRFLAAFSAGFSVLMATTVLASVVRQLDLADAREAGSISWAMAAGFGGWVLVSVLAWFAQPNVQIARPEIEAAAPLSLGAAERVVWFGEVRPSRVFAWAIGVSLILLLVITAVVFAAPFDESERESAVVTRVILVATLLLVLATVAMTASFRVRIDASGLEARSVLGWPVFRLPADDVRSVTAAHIDPFGELGGWGMRWAPGRFGIVMRAGEGLVATRRDGRIFAVTIDGAEQAAVALATAAKGAS